MSAAVEKDGLVGRTEAERAEIAARIDRVSCLKARLDGRPLTPLEIAMVLGLDGTADARRRKCNHCLCYLPETDEYFYRISGRHGYRSMCKTCRCRTQARRDNEPAAVVRRRAFRRTEEELRRRREAKRRRRAEHPGSPDRTVVRRLQETRKNVRWKMARTTDPGRIERMKARILNLDAEIERQKERRACM